LDLAANPGARNILWRKGEPLQYAFAFSDGESIALWRDNEVLGYGPAAGTLHRDLIAACEQWRALGRPGELSTSLEIVRQDNAKGLGRFEERRGAFVYRWNPSR
jgi:hypothetical protein